MNKSEYRKMISDIRAILFNDWDPIGVNDNAHLLDEYDGYICRIIQILLSDSPIQDIMNLLKDIEINEIGCSTNDTVVYDVATKLKKLRKNYL